MNKLVDHDVVWENTEGINPLWLITNSKKYTPAVKRGCLYHPVQILLFPANYVCAFEERLYGAGGVDFLLAPVSEAESFMAKASVIM